jgi:hypothetical protein
MRVLKSLRDFARRLHADRRGAISLETILIIGAIVIPVLIAIYKYGWPMIYQYFSDGMANLDQETSDTDPTN